MLVNGLETYVETASGKHALSAERYAPDVVAPDGAMRIERFEADPWPRWTFRLADGTRIRHEVFVARETAECVSIWSLLAGAGGIARLSVRPLLSGRDYHALHRENESFRFTPEALGKRLVWRPYDGVPAVEVSHNGDYEHAPVWYRNFLYAEERARGLDAIEDLAAPGVVHIDLTRGDAVVIFRALAPGGHPEAPGEPAATRARRLRTMEERRRSSYSSRVHRAVDDYVVPRGSGKTIVAGYPWFTDWGRDTFIAVRGLCLATGRLRDAGDVLRGWAGAVSEGMLPNRFPDRGDAPEYNAVDASLWYVVAAGEYLARREGSSDPAPPEERQALERAIREILAGYRRGTRYGIREDVDGLLAAGAAGVQLTWMDARVGDRVITPRIGKPVEVQALWINALRAATSLDPAYGGIADRAARAFEERFWDRERQALYDVVDVDHVPGTVDATLRPNQIFAVGGLPHALLEGERAARVVETVERHLWTPIGLRSLSPEDPRYAGRYEGDSAARDAIYHQGTVWPWLVGPFVEAWVRVRGRSAGVLAEARRRFVEPLLSHLDGAGLGHVSEIADGDSPHVPRGCPFQAWSVGELLRVELDVLRARSSGRRRLRGEAGVRTSAS